MLSRRTVLRGVASVAAAWGWGSVRGVAVGAVRRPTAVRFDVPPNACDCHIHVIGAPSRFPFAAARVYTPPPAPLSSVWAMHRALHIRRVVVVQPSVYGTDNACLLDALAQLGAAGRGVAVIDEGTPDAALTDMARAGVRGVRVNLETS